MSIVYNDSPAQFLGRSRKKHKKTGTQIKNPTKNVGAGEVPLPIRLILEGGSKEQKILMLSQLSSTYGSAGVRKFVLDNNLMPIAELNGLFAKSDKTKEKDTSKNVGAGEVLAPIRSILTGGSKEQKILILRQLTSTYGSAGARKFVLDNNLMPIGEMNELLAQSDQTKEKDTSFWDQVLSPYGGLPYTIGKTILQPGMKILNDSEQAGKEIINNALDQAGNTVHNIWDQAGDTVHNAWDKAGDTVHNVVDSLDEEMKKILPDLKKWAIIGGVGIVGIIVLVILIKR